MIVCYPLTVQLDYSELRYSLRSVEKFLKPSEVIIVGDYLPEWTNNVTQIELPDIKGRRQLSVRRKILAALEYTKEIVFFNDDFYLLSYSEIPYYYSGDLKSNSLSGSRQLQDELKKMVKPTNSFELHYPIIFNQDFKQIISYFTDDCLYRSAYCNYLGIDGIFMTDCKILNPMKPEKVRNFINGKTCFSTGANSIQSVLPVLQELFPLKSKYEI